MQPFDTSFLISLLSAPPQMLSYEAGRRIAAMRPGRAVVETDALGASIHTAFVDGVVEAKIVASAHDQIPRRYLETEDRLQQWVQNAVYTARFGEAELEIVFLSYHYGESGEYRAFVVADTVATAEAFLLRVSRHASEVDGQVLVFEDGGWHKDEKLFDAVRQTSLETLVLRGSLKDDIQRDLRSFLGSRELYARHRVPYKRGILLYGPPGNGKTHFLKGLIASMDVPCLYVKSVSAQYTNDHDSIRRIFTRARAMAPCILVFEDLETILSDANRSFYLNELDGFADNTGLIVLATTNFPERIDPAIIDRPSRFDRKYLFDLPSAEERGLYLSKWSDSLVEDMRLTSRGAEQIAAETGNFSFAYLKELTMSSTMRWMESPRPGRMDEVMTSLVRTLKDQVQRGRSPTNKSGRRVGLVPEA